MLQGRRRGRVLKRLHSNCNVTLIEFHWRVRKMMKLLSSPNTRRYFIIRRYLSEFRDFSASVSQCDATGTPRPSNPPPRYPSILFNRLRQVNDPKRSIVPLLEEWVKEGRTVQYSSLQSIIGTLKKLNRWDHALQISQWMTDRRYFALSPKDAGERLELLARVHGVEHAEMYFSNLSDKLKTSYAYGYMLKNYVQQKDVEKAEGIMQKIKELGMANNTFSYNHMILVYTHHNMHEKIDELVQEMEAKGIRQDTFTKRNLLGAYGALDIRKMEQIFIDIKEDEKLEADWQFYSIAAKCYLKAGFMDKALGMLKEVENKIAPKGNRFAAQYLLKYYAEIGSKDDVYRVWNQNKPSGIKLNDFVSIMISCLSKLGDFNGAEDIFKEWESKCDPYDIRVVNKLLDLYCRKDLVDKAKSLLEEKVAEGKETYASSWYILAVGHMKLGQMPEAIEMLKKALMMGRQGWKPRELSEMDACLDYLEKHGDVEGLEEIIGLFRASGMLTLETYHRLLRARIAAGKCASSVLAQMESDGFCKNEETLKIIATPNSL